MFSKAPEQQVSTKGRDENDSSGDEGCADDTANGSHDPHFEPLIDLPDKIEVRTGEEDETKGWWLQLSTEVLCQLFSTGMLWHTGVMRRVRRCATGVRRRLKSEKKFLE